MFLFLILFFCVQNVSAQYLSTVNSPKNGLCIKKCQKGPKTKLAYPGTCKAKTIFIGPHCGLKKACANDELQLKCPANQVISEKTLFIMGRWSYDACGSLDEKFYFSITRLQKGCIGKQECSLKVQNHAYRQRAVSLVCEQNRNKTGPPSCDQPYEDGPNDAPKIPKSFVQEIFIKAPAKVPISLSEVELFTPDGGLIPKESIIATISSKGYAEAIDPEKLFDGIKKGDWLSGDPGNPLTHTTSTDEEPQIKLMVTTMVPVARILYYGRTDCCSDRTEAIVISTKHRGHKYKCSKTRNNIRRITVGDNNQVYECYFAYPRKKLKKVDSSTQEIVIQGSPNGPLSLSEVELFMENGKRVERNMVSAAATLNHDNSASPDKLFDRYKSGTWVEDRAKNSLTHTTNITITVNSNVLVTRVVYYGRTDCCLERMEGIVISTTYGAKRYECSKLGKVLNPENIENYECFLFYD